MIDKVLEFLDKKIEHCGDSYISEVKACKQSYQEVKDHILDLQESELTMERLDKRIDAIYDKIGIQRTTNNA